MLHNVIEASIPLLELKLNLLKILTVIQEPLRRQGRAKREMLQNFNQEVLHHPVQMNKWRSSARMFGVRHQSLPIIQVNIQNTSFLIELHFPFCYKLTNLGRVALMICGGHFINNLGCRLLVTGFTNWCAGLTDLRGFFRLFTSAARTLGGLTFSRGGASHGSKVPVRLVDN